jgi:hypothetical protein
VQLSQKKKKNCKTLISNTKTCQTPVPTFGICTWCISEEALP